jgi:hypothetical protein
LHAPSLIALGDKSQPVSGLPKVNYFWGFVSLGNILGFSSPASNAIIIMITA